jgi:hypothetical protein
LNCFTPVACAVETRLNGGYRLVSTYGAKPAAPYDGDPADGFGAELAGALGAELAEALGAGVPGLVGAGVAEAVAVAGAEPLGEGDAGTGLAVVPWHGVPLIVQPAGWPAVPGDSVTNPTVTVPSGWMVASQLSFFTVTWPPSSVYEPSQSELTLVPAGSVNASVQPVTAAVPALVTVYWPS